MSISNNSIKGSSFGLVEKTHSSANGDKKILNYKIPVSAEFHGRWTRVLEQLGTRFSGGGTAILLNSIETLLPQLEELAKDIPPAKKGGAI